MNPHAPTETKHCDLAVVDDDELTLALLARMLRRSNCRARFFRSAQSAMEFLRHHRTRLLLVDSRMPGMSGLELIENLSRLDTQAADATYLCSAAEVHSDEVSRANNLGADVLLKDVYLCHKELLALLH